MIWWSILLVISLAALAVAYFAPRKEDQKLTRAGNLARTATPGGGIRVSVAPALLAQTAVAPRSSTAIGPDPEHEGDERDLASDGPYGSTESDDPYASTASEPGEGSFLSTYAASYAASGAVDAPEPSAVASAPPSPADAASRLTLLQSGVRDTTILHDLLTDDAPAIRSAALDLALAWYDLDAVAAAIADPVIPIAARAALEYASRTSISARDAELGALDPAHAKRVRDRLAYSAF